MKANPLAFAEVIKIKYHCGFPEIPFLFGRFLNHKIIILSLSQTLSPPSSLRSLVLNQSITLPCVFMVTALQPLLAGKLVKLPMLLTN